MSYVQIGVYIFDLLVEKEASTHALGVTHGITNNSWFSLGFMTITLVPSVTPRLTSFAYMVVALRTTRAI